MNKHNIFTYLFCFLISLNLSAQKPSAKDESKKPKKEKTYKDIITKDAITDKGLFDIHKVKEKYFYEINVLYVFQLLLLLFFLSQVWSYLP